MKNIKLFNKEFNLYKLCIAGATVLFALAIIIALIFSFHQRKQQIENEGAILTASEGCVKVCDKIFEEMNRSDDKLFLSHKEKINNSTNITDKYYAVQTLMNYTDEEFNRKFRDNAAREYQKLAPNNYEADKYQQKLVALYNEFYDALSELKGAKEEYTVIK